MAPSSLASLAFSLISASILLAAVASALQGTRIGIRLGLRIESALWAVPAAAVLSARLAFVARNWPAYAETPLSILDFSDGGFRAKAGLVGAVAMAAFFGLRKPRLAKPLLVACLAGIALSAGGTRAISLSGKSLLDAEPRLTDLGGNPVSLAKFVGKPVVVNLWATWCPPCRAELPLLRDAQQANPDIHFVFIDLGESRETVQRMLAHDALELNNVLLAPDWTTAAKLGAKVTPTTLLFDTAGQRLERHVGVLSKATLAELLELARAR